VPGCIFIKRTSSTEDWVVYHVGADATSPEDYYFKLNTTAARIDSTAAFNDTAPTSTEFTLGNNGDVNASSETYVAYLFAHNDGDGDFGPTGDQDIIKCGSYSQSSASDVDVDLGFEPQFLILKRSDDISQWFVLDEMRGFLAGNTSNSSRTLYANLTNAEADFTIQKTATGFTWPAGQFSVSAGTYIYIAIRRGPMAVPEDATDVFSMDMNGTTNNHYDANHVVDFAFYKSKDNAYDWNVNSRLMQGKSLKFNKTDAESSNTLAQFDVQNGWADSAALTSEYPTWMWKRAPNYFDVVAYTGDGTAGRDIPHNLGVTPEMIWVKKRSSATDSDWAVYHTGLDQPYHYIRLNLTNAYLNDPQAFDSGNHTSTTFSVGLNARTNGSSGQDYIAYLFASLDGVSKVGSYTGNGSTQNIDCGFSSGARFVLIKGADYATNWYVFDTERGIVAGNDAEIYLDSTSAQATTRDLIDPYSAGFTMTGNGVTNTSGKKYIFYAIA
jgi:hypothetical protein